MGGATDNTDSQTDCAQCAPMPPFICPLMGGHCRHVQLRERERERYLCSCSDKVCLVPLTCGWHSKRRKQRSLFILCLLTTAPPPISLQAPLVSFLTSGKQGSCSRRRLDDRNKSSSSKHSHASTKYNREIQQNNVERSNKLPHENMVTIKWNIFKSWWDLFFCHIGSFPGSGICIHYL